MAFLLLDFDGDLSRFSDLGEAAAECRWTGLPDEALEIDPDRGSCRDVLPDIEAALRAEAQTERADRAWLSASMRAHAGL